MATKAKDLTGQKFERLTAIKIVEKHPKNGNRWLCKCDCGNEVKAYTSRLTRGEVTSCGCLTREKNSKNKTIPYDKVIEKFIKKYDGKYTYPESNRKIYKNQLSRIDIICPVHGVFTRSVHNHNNGSQCVECRTLELIEDGTWIGGYCDSLFENHPEIALEKGYIYYFKIGNMYKIGITRQNVEKRVSALKHRSRKDVMVLDCIEMTIGEAYRLEQAILEKYKENRVYRRWSTELFDCDILDGRISNGRC